MREVLYRGKTDDGEWVYGNLIETKEEYSDEIIYAILEKTAEHRCCGEYCDNGWHSIVKDTIGEYTGLTDKNGNKIFEGDIIKARCNNYPYVVSYADCGFKISDDIGNIIKPTQEAVSWLEAEIVGNIYDNP